MIRKALLVVSFLFFSFSGIALAQSAGQISVVVNPSNPGPNQNVKITLQSYSFNVSAANIEWSVDGKNMDGGIGMSSYTIKTGNIGTTTNIVATITPAGSIAITKKISISPMSVDMLWQATDAIVPPLYKGKAMPTSESKIKIVAIPQIKSTAGDILSSENFIYDWKQDYKVNQYYSGYGKNSMSTSMDYLNPLKHFDVAVSTRNGGTSTSGSINVTPVNPELLLYASSPLYGPLLDNALSGFYTVKGGDTSILAIPYFFSGKNASEPGLTYEWKLNGDPIDTPSVPNSLFLHRESNERGSALLALSLKNLSKLFQESTTQINLSLQ